jgi:hypothetical protein
MSNKFEAAIQLGKGMYQLGKTVAKKLKGNKTSPTITAIKPGTQLTKKRNIQDQQTKRTSEIVQGLNDEGKIDVRTKNPLSKFKKKIKNILTPDELAKGGRVGYRRGSKKKSNIEKIKKTFGANKKTLGMQSVIYGLDKNPNVTQADPKAKFIAAANKKKKKKVI